MGIVTKLRHWQEGRQLWRTQERVASRHCAAATEGLIMALAAAVRDPASEARQYLGTDHRQGFFLGMVAAEYGLPGMKVRERYQQERTRQLHRTAEWTHWGRLRCGVDGAVHVGHEGSRAVECWWDVLADRPVRLQVRGTQDGTRVPPLDVLCSDRPFGDPTEVALMLPRALGGADIGIYRDGKMLRIAQGEAVDVYFLIGTGPCPHHGSDVSFYLRRTATEQDQERSRPWLVEDI